MRFQCRIDAELDLVASAAPRVASRAWPADAPGAATLPRASARPVPVRGSPLQIAVQGALAGAAAAVLCGCAAADTRGPQVWKYEPVFSVKNSVGSGQGYYTLGQYFDGTQAWDKAIDAYRKAIAADAQNVEARDALGVALARTGRYADAEAVLREAVALAPSRSAVRNNLGYVLLLAGKPQEAVVELKVVVAQNSANAIARANLRDAVERSGRADGRPVDAAVEPGAATPPAGNGSSGPVVAAAAQVVTVPDPLRAGYAVETPMPGTPEAETAAPAPSAALVAAATRAPADAVRASRVEISNGNGVSGMAARVGRWLAAQGVTPDRVTNQRRFVQRVTVVQYRLGFEDSAQRVARLLPESTRVEPALAAGQRADVRVVLGRDWALSAACLGTGGCVPTPAPTPAPTAVAGAAGSDVTIAPLRLVAR